MRAPILLHVVVGASTLLAACAGAVVLDLADVGVPYEGIGALSGGGGDTRLLVDYPQATQDAIWDALFKKNSGASLQIIKTEIGGDSQSTEGVEQSHSRFRGDLNCTRGYEWAVLSEAKKRNPDIVTYGLSWGAPGYLGNGTYYSEDSLDYHLSWLGCASQTWGVEIDYLGIWNEIGGNTAAQAAWIKELRSALDGHGFHNTRIVAADCGDWEPITGMMLADPELAAAIDVVGAHYPGHAPVNASALRIAGKSIWASEMWNLQSVNDYAGTMTLASDLSRYAGYGLSASIAWCLIYSWYANLNYGRATNTSNGGLGHALMTAAEPWSGYYEVNGPMAAMAHWTQFASPGGWAFLNTSGTGIGQLPGKGSYATLVNTGVAAGVTEFSLIIETSEASANQTVTFQLAPVPGAPLPAVLHVWRTVETAFFTQQPDAPVSAVDGTFTLTLLPQAIYSVTTTTGQGWVPAAPIPSSSPFPMPFTENFEGYLEGEYARYFSDMGGVWNVMPVPSDMQRSPGSRVSSAEGAGMSAYKMMQPASPINWVWDATPFPFTMVGNPNPGTNGGIAGWRDYSVSVELAIDPSVSPLIPETFMAARVGCAAGGDGGNFTFGLWGGDLVTTPAYLTSTAYPGFCLGLAEQYRNFSLGGWRVGLVSCAAGVTGEHKPVAWVLDPATGHIVWTSAVNAILGPDDNGVCLEVTDTTYESNWAFNVGALPCSASKPWQKWTVTPGAQAGTVILASGSSDGTCLGVVTELASPAFLTASIRMSVTGGRQFFPTAYNLVVYQSRTPAQIGEWSLQYGDSNVLAHGMTPLPIVPGGWHKLQLVAVGSNITAYIDDTRVATVVDGSGSWGSVAVGSGWHAAWADQLSVAPAQ